MINTGKNFEELIARVARVYRDQNILTIKKVDPPTVTFMKGGRPVTMPKKIDENDPNHLTLLDFIGAWTERDGRTLVIEAKETDRRLLRLLHNAGLKTHQFKSLVRWHNAGAAVGVLWKYGEDVRFLSAWQIADAVKAGRGSLSVDDAPPLAPGSGFVLFDFAAALRLAYPR